MHKTKRNEAVNIVGNLENKTGCTVDILAGRPFQLMSRSKA